MNEDLKEKLAIDPGLKKIQDDFKRNQKILVRIFKMNRAALIAFLKPICEKHTPDFGWDIALIWKTYTLQDDRDVPERLIFAYYDSIKITYQGIFHKPEHHQERLILDFNDVSQHIK